MAENPETEGPYSIGQGHWPGLARLIEELGELQQVLGKIMACGGEVGELTIARFRGEQYVHLPGDAPLDFKSGDGPKPFEVKIPEIVYYDKTALIATLRDEIADVQAALEFFELQNAKPLHANCVSEDGDLIGGEYYIERRRQRKVGKFHQYHTDALKRAAQAPDAIPDRRTHLNDGHIEESGSPGYVADDWSGNILHKGPPAQADSKAITITSVTSDSYGRIIAEGYAADIERYEG